MKFFKIIGRCLVDDRRKLYKLCSFIPSLIHLFKKLYGVLTMFSVGYCPRHSVHKMKIIQYLLMGLRVPIG